ncbi:putative prefoldin subunit 5, partial [Entophlyctis helioformis]
MSNPIKLEELPLQQLQAVRQQIEEEMQVLTQSFAQLRQAQAKFNEGIESLKALGPKAEGKDVLVPLTSSLYVPGQLTGVDKVIVDVGTGYFVEKSAADALDFFKRKVDYLKTNLDKLQETVTQRQNQRASVVEMIQMKQAAIQKESQAVRAAATAS